MNWIQSLDRSSVWFLLVVLTMASFPWNSHWNSIGITLLILHWLFDRNWLRKVKEINTGGSFWFFIIYFAINVIFLIGTDNLDAGAQGIEVKLSFLLLPILLSTENHLDEERWVILMKVFVLSCVMSIFVNFFHSIYSYPSAPFGRMQLSWTLTHPGLLSNYFFIASVFCLFMLYKRRNKWTTVEYLLLISLFVLLVFCVLLVSKTVIISFGLLFIFLVWDFSSFVKHTVLRLVSVILVIGVVLLFFLQLPMIMDRTIETNKNIEQLDKNIHIYNSTGSRIVSYQNSWELIKNSYMLGIGTGDANDALKLQLSKNGYMNLSNENMHVHNQFLKTWLEQGIFGLLALIAMFIVALYGLIRFNQNWAVWAAILLILNAATDDILESQAGAVFFAFIIGLCLFSPRKQIGSLYH